MRLLTGRLIVNNTGHVNIDWKAIARLRRRQCRILHGQRCRWSGRPVVAAGLGTAWAQ